METNKDQRNPTTSFSNVFGVDSEYKVVLEHRDLLEKREVSENRDFGIAQSGRLQFLAPLATFL